MNRLVRQSFVWRLEKKNKARCQSIASFVYKYIYSALPEFTVGVKFDLAVVFYKTDVVPHVPGDGGTMTEKEKERSFSSLQWLIILTEKISSVLTMNV